jgi:type IX secretion system substrate protein
MEQADNKKSNLILNNSKNKKEKMKNKTTVIHLMAFIFLLPSLLLAQKSSKTEASNEMLYSSSNLINDTKSFTNIKPKEQEFSTEKKNLLSQLEAARQSNDMVRKSMLENQLNKLDGITTVPLTASTDIISRVMTDQKPPFNNEHDYMNTAIINNAGLRSSATQTVPAGAPNAGRIWVAATTVCYTGTDTIKFYYSDNGGQSWIYTQLFYFNNNINFSPSELDMEVVYDGTTVWLFVVAGYDDFTNNRTSSVFVRINTATNAYFPVVLNWPGNTATNKYYNPHITSDNSNYSQSTYVYLTCAFDSIYQGMHTSKQKYAHITNPFDVNPSINYTQPTNNGGFFWSSGNGAFYYYWSDIAYFRTQTNANRIITVFNNTYNNNTYLAYSDDFGASIAGNGVLLDNNYTTGTRISFNGGSNNLNGMVVYLKRYSANDWDPICRNTTDGGQTWTNTYIDNSTKYARSIDIIAPRAAANIFKIGYTQDSAGGSFGYYIGGNPNGWNQPSKTLVTPSFVDTTLTKVVAGYKNGGGDDCFALYSSQNGNYLYASRLCQSTLAINNYNNSIPEKYSLEQNYPNPFNPVTNIKFSIPEGSFVTLTVFDITGKVVATLVNQQLAAGNYNYDYNASNLATGIYLYKISAADFSSVKKMMLVK